MYHISKEFRFEAAHRLCAPYSGKCNHLHGHSWRVRVGFSGATLDARGMVKDFAEFAPIREWIANKLDHATLVSEMDHDLLEWLTSHKQKIFAVKGNPTSEVLARILFDAAQALGFNISHVEVSETCTTSVEWRPF
jgi:6-pyruvoyltetrahydropterin/6-carboxytetrahydropterin synthase